MRVLRIHEEGESSSAATANDESETVQKSGSFVHSPDTKPLSMADLNKRDATLSGLRGISRVPTHTVAPARERRAYVRANLTLPLYVKTVAGRPQTDLAELSTQDISSSGVFFLSPRRIEPGTPIEMEVVLVDKPIGCGSVRMRTQACVVRAEDASRPGWHGVAASFDDITFIRDEPLPSR